MQDERRGVMNALIYSIETLRSMHKELVSGKNRWEVLGLVIMLESYVLKTTLKVVEESLKTAKPSAKDDLLEIKKRFNDFIDHMIEQN